MSPDEQSGPGGETEAAETAENQGHSTARDLTALSGSEFDLFTLGYASGWRAGIARGRELADEEAATLHREAVRVVRALVNIEPRDEAADEAAHACREAWWRDRRDERRSA